MIKKANKMKSLVSKLVLIFGVVLVGYLPSHGQLNTSSVPTNPMCVGTTQTLTVNNTQNNVFGFWGIWGAFGSYQDHMIYSMAQLPTSAYSNSGVTWNSFPYDINSGLNYANVTTYGNHLMFWSLGQNVNISVHKYINVRYRVNSGTPGTMSFYLMGPSHNYDAGDAAGHTYMYPDGQWHTASIDVSSYNTLLGGLTGFRWDLGQSDANIDIDFISLGSGYLFPDGQTSINISPTSYTTYEWRYANNTNQGNILLNVFISQPPTTAAAGPDQTLSGTCGTPSVTLAANTPTSGTGSWSIVSGSGGSFSNSASATSAFSGTAGSTYTLRWTIASSPCPSSTDDVVITFGTSNPVTITAQNDIACINQVQTLTANNAQNNYFNIWSEGTNSATDGFYNGFYNGFDATSDLQNLTGWKSLSYSLVSNSYGGKSLSLTNTGSDPWVFLTNIPSVNLSTYKYINVRYRVTAGNPGGMEFFYFSNSNPSENGSFYDQIALNNDGSWHNVSIDVSRLSSTLGNLTGIRWDVMTNDGGAIQVDLLSLGTAKFLDATTACSVAPSSTTTFSLYYANAGCTNTVTKTITVVPLPTTAAAGADQTGAATCGLTSVTLAANTPTAGTGAWSIVSGTGGSFSNAASPTSTFMGTAGTTYTLRWTISNASCTPSTDDVVIAFNQNPGTNAQLGNGLYFDGSNDYVESSVNPASNFTIETWARKDGSFSSWDIIAAKYVNPVVFELGISNAKAFMQVVTSAGIFTLSGSSTLVAGRWYHFAYTYDGSNIKVYVNGVLDGTLAVTGTIVSSSQTLKIGATRDGTNSSFNWKGILDNFRVWSVARSAAEILANINASLTTGTGLMAAYDFEQGVADGTNTGLTTLTDRTSNGYNGTLYNFALSGSTSNWSNGAQVITVANAGADQTGAATCGLTTVTLAANTPTEGSGAWTIVSGTGGSFASASSSTSTFSGVAGSTYTLRWTISNSPCTESTDDVVITFTPALSTGAISTTGQSICYAGTPTVIGSATDANGGDATITYSWRSSADSYAAAIVGATSATYTPPAGLTATTSYQRYAKDATCTTTPTVSTGTWTVTVNALPTPTFTAQPGATACTITDVTYTTQASQTNYIWTVPGTLNTDYTITSGGVGTTSNTVTLKWLTSGSKTVTINYTNANGCTAASATSSTATTVNSRPIPTFTAQPGATACASTDVTYTTQTGQTNYIWTVPGTLGTNYTITSGGVGTTSNTVTLKWLTAGSKTVTINYTNANGCAAVLATSSTATTVNARPTPTFTVQPGATACASTDVTYTTEASQTNYIWTVPGTLNTDYTISSGSIATTSNTVTLKWLTTGGKTVTINYTNTSGCAALSAVSSTATTVNARPTPTFTAQPTAAVCASTDVTYTTQSGQTSYVWGGLGTLNTDYTITSGGVGGTNNTVTLKWLTAGSKTVTINYTNANSCTALTATSSTAITVNARPTPTFTAQPGATACASSDVTYTTQASQSNYTWTVPGTLNTDYTITSGGTGTANNTVTLKWLTAGSKTVTINYSNASSCAALTATSSTATTVSARPTPTFTAQPGATACASTDVTYTTQSGQTNYIWTVPGTLGTNYTISSGGVGTTSNTLTLKWLTTGSRTVTVNYTNTNGCAALSATSSTATTVNARPTPTFTVQPGATACVNTDVTYTTQTGQTSYVWGGLGTLNTDYTITSGGVGGTNNTVTLKWLTAGSKTVTINYTNASGCAALSATSSTATTVSATPTTANAGTDQTGSATCGTTTATLAGNTPTVGTGSWSIVSGTGGTVTTASSATSTFTGVAGTTYVLRWTISNSPCTASTDDVQITFNRNPTTAAAGADQTGSTTCGLTDVTLAANTPTVGTGAWTIVSGTGGAFDDATSPTSGFSGTAGATYVLRWTISNSPCTASTDDVTITFNQNPTTAAAGPDQIGAATCGLTSVTLAANAPTVGTGLWTIVSGTGGTITTTNSPTSTFTGVAGSTYTLRWTISNSPCIASTDDVTITFSQNPTTAAAGADQTGATTCGLTAVTLAGNAPTAGTGAWSIISGTGGIIANSALRTSTFTGTAGATYTLRWTISTTSCTPSTDDVVITFNRNPATANAGADQTGASTCGSTTVTLGGNAATVGTGLWTIVSGTGGTITSPTSPTSTFTGVAGSNYTLRWTISNSPCTASADDVTISFNQNVTTAAAGPDQTSTLNCGLTTATLAANAATTGVGAWSIISGTGGSFSSTTSPTATFTGTAGSSYTLRWTISNSPCTASADDVVITLNARPTPTFTAQPGATAVLGANVTYTTEAGQTNYIWSVPGTANTDYAIVSGGIGTTSNTVTLKWFSSGIKTVTVNYTNAMGCTATAVTSSTATTVPLPSDLYVDGSVTASGSGTTWGTAYKYLSEALAIANAGTGDCRINIAQGTYYPTTNGVTVTDRTLGFLITRKGISLYGGYQTGGLSRNTKSFITTLSGSINNATATDNLYHVLIVSLRSNSGGATYLDGFMVANGYSSGSNASPLYNSNSINNIVGAGIALTSNTSIDQYYLNDLLIKDNYSTSNNIATGGGIESTLFNMTISNSFFVSNSSRNFGGAVNSNSGNIDFINDVFASNATGIGGSAASGNGGALRFLGNSNIVNCTFISNSATGVGGAIRAANTGVTINIYNSIFYDNKANGITNTVNSSDFSNGINTNIIQIKNSYLQSTPYGSADGYTNVTLANNKPASPGNTNPGFADYTSPLGVDGLFGTADDGARITGAATDCLDQGDNTFISSYLLDITGNPRVVNTTVDMGAYETAPKISVATATFASLDACINSTSPYNTFVVSGADLTANITITAPTGFQVSTTSGSGYASSVTLTPTSGAVAATNVYVKLTSTATAGSFSGNISLATTGATTKTLAVVGIVSATPTTSAAGADQTSAATCGLTTVTLAANTATVGTGAWSIVSGTGGSFADPSSPTSSFSGTAGSSYTLRWTISNGACTASTDDVVVTFNRNPTTAAAGADQTDANTCGLTSITLAGNTTTVGTGAWSIISGTGGAVTTVSSATSSFSGVAGSSYTLRWTTTNGVCTSTDDVLITFNINPTTAAAGIDQTGSATCGLTSVVLAGNTPSVGTGAWTILTGLGGTVTTASSATSTFSGVAGSSYSLRWINTNGVCSSADDVAITFNQNPTTANAGADQIGSTTCGVTTVTLDANTATVGTGLWTIVSGTGGSFADASSPASTFSGVSGSSYTLRWTITNSPCTESTDDVVITFNTTFSSGTINTTGETICNAGTPSVIGSATAASGGPTAISYTWRSSADNYAAAISGATAATYTPPAGLTTTTSYRRYANDAACTTTPTVSTGTWTVTVRAAFYAGAITTTTQTLCYGGTPTAIPNRASASGGDANITYSWASSTTSGGTYTTIAGATSSTYTPPAGATVSMYYRRYANDGTCNTTPVQSYANNTAALGTILVSIRSAFTSGTISSTGQSICIGGTPTAIGSTTAASGGNNIITYSWRSSADNYATAISLATAATYTPPSGLTATTSYKRYAKDGTCNTTPTESAGTWTVTVRPTFSAGEISAAGETICYNGNPAVIGSTTDGSGGDASITYKWQANGVDIASSNAATYDPPTGLTATTTYTRYAKDASCNTTFTLSTGSYVVTVRPNFSTGTISSTGETVCYNGDPAAIGSTADASGGDETITYKWKANGVDIENSNATTYDPPAGLTATTTYTRWAIDATCNTTFTQSSGSYVVTVRPLFTSGTISSTGETICYNGNPAVIGSSSVASGGDENITYQWQADGVDILGATAATYDPPTGLTATTTYTRYAKDATCNTTFTVSSGTYLVTVNPNFSAGTISSAGESICYNGNPALIGSTTDATGGDASITYKWQANGVDIASSNAATYDPPTGLTSTTTYTRYAKDATCNTSFVMSSGSFVVTVRPNFSTGTISSAGETICYNGDPAVIGSTADASGGDASITYKWQANGVDIAGSNAATYDPPLGLSETTTYTRFTVDATCNTSYALSSGSYVVTVRPNFTAGTISSTGETICYNGDPALIGSTTASSGGDANITYKWQANGVDIASSNAATYNPPAGLTTTTSYTRWAIDGTCNTTYTQSSGSYVVTVNAAFTSGTISSTGETICYNGNPAVIGSSADASGGDASITYKWQANGVDIASSNAATYDPPTGLTTTTTYTRYAKDATCNTSFALSSGSYVVTVRSNFTAGTISSTGETICYNGNPAVIGSSADASGGDASITYKWQVNGVDIASSNSATYDPPTGLTATKTYTRFAKDATCNTTFTQSSGSFVVTVRSNFTTGAINTTQQNLCYGGTPTVIGSTTEASGGDGNITYSWVTSTGIGNNAVFTTISGATSATYTPPTGATVSKYYKRNANDGTCNTTPTLSTGYIYVRVYAAFSAGTIASTGETICNGGTPTNIGSSTAASGGNGTITYSWRSSADGYATDIASTNATTFTPPSGLTATTSYRRYAKDVTCNATPTASSGTWTVTVLPVFSAGTMSSAGETICYNGNPAAIGSTTAASGGDANITYKWQANGVDIASSNAVTYDPPAGLTATTTYTRFAVDATCSTTYTQSSGSYVVTVNALPTPTFTAQAGSSVCINSDATYTTQSGQSNYVWSVSGTLGTDYSITSGGIATTSNTVTIKWLTTGSKTVSVRYTNSNGCIAVTDASSFTTVADYPIFLTQPSTAAQSLCSGAGAISVEVDPGSGGVASYQWFSNANNSNAGGSLLVTNTTSSSTNSYAPTSTGYHYVTVTNTYGCSTTSTVSGLISITAAPTISSQPSASTQSLCINGTPTNLSVTAAAGSGTISTYKWYSNSSNSTTGGTLVSTTLSSLTTNAYTPSTAAAGTTYYYCVVTNSNGCSVTSTVSGGITVVTASVGGTATAASSVVTSGGTTTISLTGYTGNIQWQQSADGSTGWSNVSGGSGATTATYTTAALSATTYYKALVTSGICAAASSNNATVSVSVTNVAANILVVAAGGSGGAHKGGEGTGGGGGGGVAHITGTTLSNATYTVTVAGTTAGRSVAGNQCGGGGLGNNGGNSIFSGDSKTITAKGGGGGGGACSGNGDSGGSGGGGHAGNATAANTGGGVILNTTSGLSGGTISLYGNIGGTSPNVQNGGGGGGATVAPGISLNGGAGVTISITGTANVYGSGGGANCTNSTGGSGGTNAGNGASGYTSSRTGLDAANNFGGGGGGNNSAGILSGTGGSGVVIISYASPVAMATGGTITSYSNGGVTYQVHTFTSSGSFVLNVVPVFYVASTGVATSVCTSASARTTSLPYTASGGSPTSYTIDWNAAANTAGFADQGSTSHAFAAGGGSVTGITIPANIAAGTYTGTMTITNGSSTTTQSISLAIGSAAGTISGAGTVTTGTNSTTLTLSGYTGSIQWQSSTDNSTFSDIGGSTAATYTATNLTTSTFYKAVVTNGACTSATSAVATITVASASTAFSITGSADANTINNNVASVVDPAIVVTANGTVSGFTVTISGDYTDGDVLGYTGSLPSGVTAAAFNTTSRSINFTGTASAADWQAFLRTVTITSTSNCYPSNRKVSFLPSNKYFNYFNGHYYDYISTPLNWAAAKADAASRSFYGRQGYLVTVTSEAENNYIWKLLGNNSWIGLSCVHTEINAALGYNRFSSTTYGQFYWVTGPEKGTLVSTGLNSPVAASGAYNNWLPNEPNNYRGWGENSGHMYNSGTNASYWNDYPGSSTTIPYIVEYGGSQGDDTISSVSFTRDIIISGSPAGTISGAATVCNGTNTTTLTFSGGGSIQRWEYSTDNFVTAGTTVSSTASTLSVTNLTSSRYYRAVVNTTGCTNLASSSALITVALSTAGSITAASADVCGGGNAVLTLNGNSGSVQKWQVSTSSDFTTGVTDISNTTNSLTHALSANGTYYFRAAVLNSACVGGTAVYTDGYPVTVTTGTPPVAGTVNSVSYCGGSNSGTLTLTGATGTSYQWQLSTDGGYTWSNAGSTSATLSYSAITRTTKYRVLVTSGSCGTATSSVGTVAVNTAYVDNTITLSTAASSNAQTIFYNQAISNIRYVTTGASGATFSGLPSGVTGTWSNDAITISGTPLNYGSSTYTITLTGGCAASTVTATGTIVVNTRVSTAAVLSLSGDATICNGNSTNIKVTITDGTAPYTVVYSNGTSNTTVTNYTSGANISVSPTATTTYSLVSVSNTYGFAGTGNSGTATVTVTPVSLAGTISGAGNTCYGTAKTLTLSGNRGTIKWQVSSTSSSSGFSDIAGATASTYTVSNTTAVGTYYYQAVVTNGVCSAATSTAVTVSVTEMPVISSQSTATQTVCQNSTPAALTVTATGTGLTYQWYSRTIASNSGGTDLGSANGAQTASYTPSTSAAGTLYYYCVVSIGNCSATSAVSGAVVVNATSVAGTISGAGSTCFGAAKTLTLSGNTGTIQWQVSTTSSSSGFSNIDGATASTYVVSSSKAAGTYYYQAVVTNGVCSSSTSSPATVTVYSAFSTGTISSAGETICYNGDPAVIGSTTAASGGDAAIAYKWQANGVDIASTNAATYDPPTGLTATTTYTRYAKDATCNTTFTVSSGSYVVTVRPNFTTGTISSTGETICYNGNPALIGSTTASTGGDASITYIWQANGVDIASSNSATYDPPTGLTATTTYTRYAKDATCNTTFTVSSGSHVVTVRSNFTSGTISSTGETICYNGNPALISSSTAASGGDASITYKWQANGVDIASSNSATYDPPTGLTATTTYTRYAKDATCNTTFTLSSGSFVVTVRPNFSTGTIASTGETICYNGDPGLIGSTTAASGGDASITYEWRANGVVIASSNAATYDPPAGLATTTTYTRWAKEGTCNTTFTVSTGSWTVTVSQLPTTANAGADQNVSSSGGLIAATLAGNTPTVGTGLWTIVSGTGGTITTPTSPTSTFNGTAGVGYILRWTISNSPCNASSDEMAITSTYYWTGSGGDDMWGTGNNWSTGTQPNAGAEIVISSGNPKLNTDYSVGGSLTLSGTATLTVNPGKTLSIAAGGVAAFGGRLVTFRSDATGTGQMGVVAGTLTGATNITVERHVPAKNKAFRFFGSPVTTTTTIKFNWMENATLGKLAEYPYNALSVNNPKPGYGTLITGTGGNANGFDESQTSSPSLFTFNNGTGAWVTSTNTSATIAAGSAYRMYVRGDRSYGITAKSEPPAGATILRTNGTMVQGTLTTGTQLPALSQAANGWSLVGNPYQSVVDMSSADVVKNDLTPYYYVWDPRLGTRGAYVSYNLNLPVNGSSNPTASAVNRYVQPGQAFFVQNSTTAGSNSIVFKEVAKGAASNQSATFARNNTRAGGENDYTIDATNEKAETTQTQAANYASLSAILYYTDSLAVGAAATDATRAIFGSQFSNIVDGNDGRKFTNLDETMSIKQGTNLLSMELRGLPDTSTKLPLNITQYGDKKYTMRLLWDEKLSTDTLVAYLRDKYTNKETEVRKTGNTDFEYLLDADAKSSAVDRFEIFFRSTRNQVTAVINYDNGQYIKIYPNPVRTILNIDFDLGQNRLVDMKVFDMTGRLVMDRPGMRKGSTLTMTSLAKGTYNVKIWGNNGKLLMSEKIIKD